MASYTARKNKEGEIISYQIKVSRGRDKVTGKQLTPYTMTYTPPDGWSKKAIERDLLKTMGEFESACKRGEVKTKEEAKAAAIQEKEEERRRELEKAKEPLFPELVNQFLQARKETSTKTTIRCYTYSLIHPAEYFKEYKITEISPAMVRQFFTYLRTDAKNKFTGKNLEIHTIQHDYNVMNTLFEYAVDMEYIAVSPMRNIKMPTASKDEKQKEPIVYNEKQVAYIIDCLQKEPLMWRCLVLFLIYSGCRRGEAAGLKWCDIDFKTGKIQIQRNRVYTEKTGVYTASPKNGKARTIYINAPELFFELRVWKKEQAVQLFKLNIPNDGFCFTSTFNKPIHPDSIGQYFRHFGKKYNLPGFHPHALRHTMATISIANGADVVSVSKKLGHSNVSITLNTYSHANEQAQKKASDIFKNAIDESETKQAQ